MLPVFNTLVETDSFHIKVSLLEKFLLRENFAKVIGWVAKQLHSSLICMRMRGLEPPLLSELEPKSSASANSATSACQL